ncbi:VTC domain-containing protein [Roseburia sp. AM51-8]|uniref:VTC domain-containing protein n=1 Tax=Roseburia sp. AM51-8 TaxID=2292366 RepID=UPI001FAB21A1|nr:VTC domain-containing protein [Roseburia sp. AM51-8]
MPLSREEAKKYLEEGDAPKETGQIYREVDYFFTHYGIRPKRYIAYDRLTMFGKDDPDFRVTFDVAIRSRSDNLTLQSDENTTLLLTPGYYLMEVKISDAMPKWFVDLLSKYGIYNTSFSKYGMDQWRDLHCDCGRHRRPAFTVDSMVISAGGSVDTMGGGPMDGQDMNGDMGGGPQGDMSQNGDMPQMGQGGPAQGGGNMQPPQDAKTN